MTHKNKSYTETTPLLGNTLFTTKAQKKQDALVKYLTIDIALAREHLNRINLQLQLAQNTLQIQHNKGEPTQTTLNKIASLQAKHEPRNQELTQLQARLEKVQRKGITPYIAEFDSNSEDNGAYQPIINR